MKIEITKNNENFERLEVNDLSKFEKVKLLLKDIIFYIIKSIEYTILICICLEKGWIFNKKIQVTCNEFNRILLIMIMYTITFIIIKYLILPKNDFILKYTRTKKNK